MELPSCPSCHQSVLDDEAELCPFCGAPLKKGGAAATKASPARPAPTSRPASAPPSAAPQSRTTNPTKPSATQRPGSPGSANASPAQNKKTPEKAARSAAEEALEESFKVDSSAGIDVPQASRQRSQTRPYKVQCPMCETVGYVPRSSAGKEIRCANRDCMVPVFVAPKPEKQKEEEEARPKKLTTKNLLIGLSAVILIAVAVGFFIKNQPEPIQQNKNPEPPPAINSGVAVAPQDKTNDANAVQQPVVEKPLTLSEERDRTLAMMSSAAQDQGHNRSRPLCDRIVAQTAADCGNLELAAKFLERLNNAENGLTFYRVPPLTAVAWRHLKAGDKAAAEKALDESLKAAADLPVEGVFSIDTSAWLAAALTAAGREKDAPALVARFPSSGPSGRLAAAEARAVAWNSYDIDRADQDRPLFDVQSLQLPVVVEISVARSFATEALRLAQSTPNESLRSECEIAWLEAVQRAKSSSVKPAEDQNVAVIDAVLAKLKPAAQARSHARFGLLRLRANDKAGAESELKAAVTALGSAQAGAEFELPSPKEIYEWQPSDLGPAHQNALAYAEIARLQGGLGQAADASRSLSIALDCVRASAPSPSAIDAKERINKKDRAGLRSELQATLKLRDAQVDAAANQYGRNLLALGEAAEARFALELEILDTALAWADPAQIWKLISNRMTPGDVDRMEPFASKPLPWQLIVRLNSKGANRDEKTLAAIRKAVADIPPKPLALLDEAISSANEATPTDLAEGIKSIEGIERSDQERAGLIIVDRLVASGQFDKAFKFAREILDPNLKEETMEWCVAYASRLGQGRAVKEHLHTATSSLSSTQNVAAWRGFLIGLLARERAEPATATASPTAAAPAKATPPAAPQPPAGADSKQAEAPKG
ncbi:MAG TPA: hypothetical protein VG055_03355 [Planctomycetaceae bacterium]|nr:hypothetical protein [Planctomycetaceae bacterium]